MPYSADVTDEWEYWDNVETVTYRSNADPADPVEVEDVTARRLDRLTDSPEPDGMQFGTDTVVWLLPAVLLSEDDGVTLIEPQHLDEIIDADGNVFVIQQAQRRGQGRSIGHYECPTVQNRTAEA